MKKKEVLSTLWGVMFILCGLLGFVEEPKGILKVLLVVLAVGFFVPPWLLLRGKDVRMIQLVRNLSAASLAATLVMLVVNLLSISYSTYVGDILYGFLVIISTPMMCSQYWILSMFLWACLLMAAIMKLKKKK